MEQNGWAVVIRGGSDAGWTTGKAADDPPFLTNGRTFSSCPASNLLFFRNPGQLPGRLLIVQLVAAPNLEGTNTTNRAVTGAASRPRPFRRRQFSQTTTGAEQTSPGRAELSSETASGAARIPLPVIHATIQGTTPLQGGWHPLRLRGADIRRALLRFYCWPARASISGRWSANSVPRISLQRSSKLEMYSR